MLKRRGKLAIIHFSPIEQYPPVMNLLDYFSQTGSEFDINVYTMFPPGNMRWYKNESPAINIIRKGKADLGSGVLVRMLNYLLFYISTSLHLLGSRPGVLLSFETLSVLPAFIHKKFVSRRSALMIHYHEYMSRAEIRGGMKLNRIINKLEKRIYPQTDWVSHTNSDRMNRFLEDNKGISIPHTYILPNYPSRKWAREKTAVRTKPVKVIYVGSLSLDTMFTTEFAEWILSLQGAVTWDIYSNNLSEEVINYINSLDSELITYKGACNYNELPDLLVEYDAGVILYKGHIPNYVYNAPNKLFEYLSSGLDVWVPDVMVGCKPYVTSGTWPKVTAINFLKLSELKLDTILDHNGLSYKKPEYFYENVLDKLLSKIKTLLDIPAGYSTREIL